MGTTQSPYTAIPTSTCKQRQKARATNLCCLPTACLHQLRSWQARAGEGISHFHRSWLGFCVFDTASSVGANKPPLLFPSRGCFKRDASLNHLMSEGQPRSQLSLSHSVGVETGISTFAGSSSHPCPHCTDQRERVFQVLLVCLERLRAAKGPAVLHAG